MFKIHQFLTLTLIMAALSLSGKAQHAHLNADNGKSISTGALVHHNVEEIKGLKMGPFVKLDNGNILTVEGTDCLISSDNGNSWENYPVFDDAENYLISNERAILKTSNGVIILAFMNLQERANWNWQEDISDSPGARLPTYTVRSLDGGKTWQDVQKLHNEWTGAVRDMIETENGNIVFTSMMMRHHPGHHTVLTYKSGNEGKTWERSNIIDLGGIGHHSGVTEATLEELKFGKLWLLMRTNWGTFWEAFSMDDGITWENIRPTDIEASSAPGLLKRLESGKLILVWNRRFPEGTDQYPSRGGDRQWSEVAASNHREELSISFSENDGNTWSEPIVIAKVGENQKADPTYKWVSYPYVFERNPGELWVTTMQGGLRVKFNEKDFTH
ncbi:sialidase family protein [Cyclobacterium amurskyense]|uniref:Glycosyl hydrolase n=1 Tax=Cyclobacterium amurskyense TaxID=320787 RepID=A0A0H4PTV5_9BACT|nr:sialidase family protein [Cyclobacterium amurskyense]AKP51792.1 Glycosyl hydrolase [Cyclobacterium amurskyense]|tara:strand:+ start:22474 stop:23634 length:1161 start_codon:yes stop_codon:yes gene_type:complete